MRYVLDTHIWIWWNMSPEKLSTKVRTIIENKKGSNELILSIISVWEFSKLIELQRLTISCEGESWIEEALDDRCLTLWPLTPKIVWHSTLLPQPFHKDPGDQIIVSTTRELKATLLTKDHRLIAYKHVPTLW